MTKDEDFKLLKIQTVVLKVNIHCDGCKSEVKKLLHKIEGVYKVQIDADHQKVTVSGNVDSATLIKRLVRSGKHAELWSQKPGGQNKQQNQQQKQPQQPSALKLGGKNAKDQQKQSLIKGLEAFKNQHKKATSFSSDEDEDDEDEDDEDEDDDFAFLGNKLSQINLLAPLNGTATANAPKKNGGGGGNNGNGGNGNNVGGGKKGGGGGSGSNPNPNPNPQGMKHHPNGADQKGANHHAVVSAGGKMGAAVHHLGGGGGGVGNPNAGHGQGKLGHPHPHPIHPMTGLGLNGLGFPHQAQQQPSAFQGHPGVPPPGLGAAAGVGGFGGQHHHPVPMMMNQQGYQSHPASMMMGPSRPSGMMMAPDSGRYMQQAQMMYHRSPQVTPYTGYYPYYPPPPAPHYYYNYPNQYQSEASDYGAHLFSDENTHSCAVM